MKELNERLKELTALETLIQSRLNKFIRSTQMDITLLRAQRLVLKKDRYLDYLAQTELVSQLHLTL